MRPVPVELAPRPRRRGVALMLMVPSIVMLLTLGALAVDWGHMLSAKAELQTATDNIARHAASSLDDGVWPTAMAAFRALGDNTIAGRKLTIRDGSMSFGTWDEKKGEFVLRSPGDARVNAVRVRTQLDADRGRGVGLFFAPLIGVEQASISAEAIVRLVSVETRYDGRSQIYLAGMPSNARVEAPWGRDTQKRNAATQIDLPITPGQALVFEATGLISSYGNGENAVPPEGLAGSIVRSSTQDDASNHGMSGLLGPNAALVGVFLSDDRPDQSGQPADGDFSKNAALEATEVRPPLKQLFYIGNGKTPAGLDRRIVPPPGATRLFVGRMDWMCKDNAGTFDIKVRPESGTRLVR